MKIDISKKNIFRITIIILYLAILSFITYKTINIIVEYKKFMFINDYNIKKQELKINEINKIKEGSIDYWNKIFLEASLDREIAILKVSEMIVFVNFLLVLGILLLVYPIIFWFFDGLLLKL